MGSKVGLTWEGKEWIDSYDSGCNSFDDAPRSGRPTSVSTLKIYWSS